MFCKYLIKSFKKSPLYYIMMILLEAALIVVVLTANGIVLDSVTESNNSKYMAKHMELRFSEPQLVDDISDKLNSFAESIPYDYILIDINISGNEQRYSFYGGLPIKLFSSYQAMTSYMNDTFGLTQAELPTKQQFENHDNVVLVGNDAGTYLNENSERVSNEYRYNDCGKLLISQEEYCVVGHYSGYGVYVFWGTEPTGTEISGIDILLKNVISEKQASEISNLFCEIFGEQNVTDIKLPQINDLLEQRKNTVSICICVVMQVIVVFNIMLLFKYMSNSKRRLFSVFRFCGFGPLECIMMNCGEFLCVSFVSSFLASIAFELFVKSCVGVYYSIFDVAFTLDFYIEVAVIYMAISLLIYFICIAPSLGKSVADEARRI